MRGVRPAATVRVTELRVGQRSRFFGSPWHASSPSPRRRPCGRPRVAEPSMLPDGASDMPHRTGPYLATIVRLTCFEWPNLFEVIRPRQAREPATIDRVTCYLAKLFCPELFAVSRHQLRRNDWQLWSGLALRCDVILHAYIVVQPLLSCRGMRAFTLSAFAVLSLSRVASADPVGVDVVTSPPAKTRCRHGGARRIRC